METVTKVEGKNLLDNHLLVPGTIYEISNATTQLIPIQLMAVAVDQFGEAPLIRTRIGCTFDRESYNIRTDKLTCTDHINCVVRCTAGVWRAISDSGHTSQHLDTIISANKGFTVKYTKTYHRVNGCSTSVDETYSKSDLCITCGASVGLSTSLVLVHKTIIVNGALKKEGLSNNEASITGSNIWFSAECSCIF